MPRLSSLKFSFLFSFLVCISQCLADVDCPLPSVPSSAKYINVTISDEEWKIKYVCDSGYELFGEDVRECQSGKWKPKQEPHCAVNVALNKPASSSSVVGAAEASKAVDGSKSTVHEGSKCAETKSEKSPWWTVDLLDSYPVKHVRITTRCCDDVPIQKAEIRVGNSTTPGNNPLCNWIPRALEEGSTETLDCYEDLVGRYVSIVMTGVETVLSVCEVEVFSSEEISLNSCSKDTPPDELSVFQGTCYRFVPDEQSGFDKAKDKCSEDKGYHLINDLDEDSTSYIVSRLEMRNQGDDHAGLMAWIGAEREPNQLFGQEKWNWVTGSAVGNIEWGRGQPNNYNQEQNCAVLDSELDWKWNDISCRISAYSICQGSPATCPSPPVAEGTYYTGKLEIGEKIKYHCPVGDMPIGETDQTCLETGTWSGEPVTCKKVDCGQVPGLADGEVHVLDGRTTWGARVMYKCKENYTLMTGDDIRTCEENGWTGGAPRCVYTKCGEPTPVSNAEVKQIGGEGYSLGTKVVYTCHTGHKASGSLSRECLIGGKWSGSPPKCEFVDCGDPPKVDNAQVQLLDGRTSFGAEVDYTCKADYKLTTEAKSRKCESNGRWTRNVIDCEIVKCPAPKAPTGGRVSGYDRTVHSKIEYSCLTGHILEGSEVLTCLNSGEWSDNPPICRFVDCGSLDRIDGGTVHYVNGSTHLGSVARYSCERSHSLDDGTEERVCQQDGKWSGSEPSCSEITCSLPARPNNTIISVSSTERLHGTSVLRTKLSMKAAYRVGSTLKYRCERGFILASDDSTDARVMTRRCTTSRTWTGSEPKCTYIDCGPPEKPENSEVIVPINGTYYGAVAFYKCIDHFNLDGFEKRRCESDGTWKPEAPTCTETLCKALSSPNNGNMVLTTLRIGGRAKFTCKEGFALKGDDDVECLSSGSWSSWPPTCIEIDCGQPDEIDSGRVFLANSSTKIGSVAEYHCLPGYKLSGSFERTCLEDGYWSGREPSCSKPIPVTPSITSDNVVDGTKNVRAGTPLPNEDSDNGSIGTWIGVALGLIVVIGLLILGLFFYRKKRAISSKPPPYRDRNSNAAVLMSGIYGSDRPNGNGVTSLNSGLTSAPAPPVIPSHIGQRPPPPIQMYSMDESSPGDHNPIYDTINEDTSSGSAYSRSSASEKGHYAPTSTFNPSSNGRVNGGYNEYDVPEGKENGISGPVGTVTINGIAV